MPSLAVEFPSFEPKWFLRNPHLQTLYAGFLEWFRPLPGGGEDLAFPMNNGTPDTLIGRYHAPAGNASTPLVVIVHGLPGDQNSAAVVRSYRHFHANGYPVMRLNLRGAGAQNGQTEQLYHAGRTEDIREVLGQLENGHPEKCQHGIVMMGFSFGGCATRMALDERMRRALAPDGPGFAAHVDFYGPCHVSSGARRATGAPLLTLRGSEDACNDPVACRKREDELRALGVDVRAHVFEGAAHAWQDSYPRLLLPDQPYVAGCEVGLSCSLMS